MSDDNEPITVEWLLSEGFKKVPSDLGPRYADNLQLDRVTVWELNGTGKWVFDDADWIELKTRKHMRILIELAEVRLQKSVS